MAEERGVRFVTEESLDLGCLSPGDSSREEEEEAEGPPLGVGGAGGVSGGWSPLSGARLEEMVREATRLVAQLEGCHLPPPPGTPSPRSPRRETFVVKDSPVRALLPTVETPPRAPPKPRGGPAATSCPATRKVLSSCPPPAAPKGPPRAKGPPPSRVGPPRPCPPQGQGVGTRGRSEPPRVGTAGQLKGRGGAAASGPPPTRQPRARAPPGPSSRPLPPPSAIPRGPAGGAAPGGRGTAPRGGGGARVPPPATGSGFKAGPAPPPSRLRPPRKMGVSSTPR